MLRKLANSLLFWLLLVFVGWMYFLMRFQAAFFILLAALTTFGFAGVIYGRFGLLASWIAAACCITFFALAEWAHRRLYRAGIVCQVNQKPERPSTETVL